jgi:hypothetical protein
MTERTQPTVLRIPMTEELHARIFAQGERDVATEGPGRENALWLGDGTNSERPSPQAIEPEH